MLRSLSISIFTVTFYIDLAFKPNFNRYPLASQTLGPLGGNITLPCQAEGAPLPTVSVFISLLPSTTVAFTLCLAFI